MLTVVLGASSTAAGTPTWAYVVGAVLAAALTAMGATYVARRANSGKIGTSEAADLWAESNAMRKELRDETVALRQEVAVLRGQQADLEEKHLACQQQTAALESNVARLEARVSEMQRTTRKPTPRRRSGE